jgi:hypothetical protein
MSISNIITSLKTITPTIKNKYVSHHDLKMLIGELNELLVIAQTSQDEMIGEPHVGLDVIFPAIGNLKLYLNSWDLGAIALTSKTLYDLMVLNFTELVTSINILKHYILGNHYYHIVNIKFNDELFVPIPVNIIMHRQLRNIIGCEEYFKIIIPNGHYHCTGYAFYMEDILHCYKIKNNITIDLLNLVCVFCKKFKYDNDHNNCAIDYYGEEFTKIIILNNDVLRPMYHNYRGSNTLKTKYMFPELEHIEKNKKHKMLDKMKDTCNGKFNKDICVNKQCPSCHTLTFYHNLNYED